MFCLYSATIEKISLKTFYQPVKVFKSCYYHFCLMNNNDNNDINRTDGLEKQILGTKIRCGKSRGRQYTKYTNSLKNYVTRKLRKESPNNELVSRQEN